MGQPIIIVPNDPEPADADDVSAAFAAGAAAAVSVAAAETAQTAEAIADAAQAEAANASRVAAEADMSAEAAHRRIDDILIRLDDAFDDVAEILNGTVGVLEQVDDGAPPIVDQADAVDAATDAVDDTKPGKKTKTKRDLWWGGR